jgi:hypothetical protein
MEGQIPNSLSALGIFPHCPVSIPGDFSDFDEKKGVAWLPIVANKPVNKSQNKWYLLCGVMLT